jgi:hypothetical protein
VHTSTQLRSESFEIELDGRPADIHQVLPGFGSQDRVGAVVREPFGAVGASNLLLAAVTAFYDAQRARGEDFYVYPDYFLFHVGGLLGDHSMLEVWPSHKEVVVPDDSERILEAINDRGVRWLLVPEGEPKRPQLGREALASARSRIAGSFVYSPTGRVTGANVRIAGNEVTESCVNGVLDPGALLATLGDAGDPYAASVARRAGEVEAETRSWMQASRARLREDGRTVETYREVSLDQALSLLSAGSPVP